MTIIQELLLRTNLFGHSARSPALEVDAAHDQGQLGTELYRFFDREPIAKLVENRSQDAIGLMLIRKIAVITQLFQPHLRLLHRMGLESS